MKFVGINFYHETIYAAFDGTNFELTQEDINLPEGLSFKLKNNNFYTNASYSGDLGEDWKAHFRLSIWKVVDRCL